MKKISLPIAIALLLFACTPETPSGDDDNGGIDSLPTKGDTASWHKSNPGIGYIRILHFLSAANGFCGAQNGIYSTQDSGKTWTPVETNYGAGEDLFFVDAQHGYFITRTAFGRTTDGGATWQVKELNLPDLRKIFFLSPSTGYVTTLEGLYKTIDGGATWHLLFVEEETIWGVYFQNEQKGWIGNSYRSLMMTTDSGAHFTTIPSAELPEFVYNITFTDSLHGWTNNTTGYLILNTTDGGATWQPIETIGKTFDIHFINNTTGYRATGDGISKSTDGGHKWNQILKGTEGIISEVFFQNEELGWAGDSKGNIYRWSK